MSNAQIPTQKVKENENQAKMFKTKEQDLSLEFIKNSYDSTIRETNF